MSYNDDYREPDGYCEECGLDLNEDPGGDHEPHHRLCWACWRGDDPDEEPDEDEPDQGPVRASFTDQRWVRLLERLAELERRVDALEGARRAA